MTSRMRSPSLPAALLAWAMVLASPFAKAHGDEDHGPAPVETAKVGSSVYTGVAPRRLPDGSLWMPKPVQRSLSVRTVLALTEEHALALDLHGRVVADPNASGKVQASQEGRIEPGPQGLPLAGQKVSKGQVLAYLRPTASSLDRGNQIATLAELDAQQAQADRKLSRYAQLEGAIPRKEIESARDERDALRKRRAAISASMSSPEALRAPLSGTLVSAQLSIGQVVDARELLFEIVDPTRLMIEALAYEPALAQGLGKASAILHDGKTLALKHVGGGPRLQDQAMPLLFAVMQSQVALAIGQPVKVTASTSRTLKGIAVPRMAVVRNAAGETVVWLHPAPEQFTPRRVSFQTLDGASVLVTEGIQDGERIVTEGASLLAQVR